MQRFFEKNACFKFKRTVLPFICMFVLGLLLARYPANWRAGEFCRALSDALMIAGLIGSVVELWSASVLVDHATDQLSERLVGYGLPPAAQALIHDLVHKTKRVYRDYRAIYRIEAHPAKADYVIVRITLLYKAVNNGTGAEAYSPSLAEEQIYNPSAVSLECSGRRYAHGELQSTISENRVVTFSIDKNVRITPSSALAPIETLKSDQFCSVRWEYTVEMPKYYSAVLAFVGVTVNPVVEVQESEGFDVFATLDDCVHAPGGHSWAYNRAFIGGQHVRVWWKPVAVIA